MSKDKDDDETGLFIPAGLFIGFSLGFLFDNLPAGIFGGLGVGFLLYVITENFRK
ncbi:MAG: hypothetical protein ABEK17_02090 [Candidatus Aenigmatarchaeota archaeon]